MKIDWDLIRKNWISEIISVIKGFSQDMEREKKTFKWRSDKPDLYLNNQYYIKYRKMQIFNQTICTDF